MRRCYVGYRPIWHSMCRRQQPKPPLAAFEASFKGKGPWKKGLPRILETLEALGRARREENNDWRGT